MIPANETSVAWNVITCEYPPMIGGVGDYTRTLATALAASRPVHVWCPQQANQKTQVESAFVHPILRSFSPRMLRRLGAELDRQPSPRRLFVQWVPQGFGYRSLNVAFASWLAWRSWQRGDHVHLMVHEPYLRWSLRPARFVAAFTHRVMLVLAGCGATRVWLSTLSWEPLVKPYVPRGIPIGWLPVPASLLGLDDPEICNLELTHSGRHLTIGHFGTYSRLVTPALSAAMDAVLADSNASMVRVGRNSDSFREAFLRTRPHATSRVRATGALPAEALTTQLQSCDVMMQPYPDGVSARRTSTLTLLALGLPIVTNTGLLSEPLWRDDQAVALVDGPDGERIGKVTVGLLTDNQGRANLRGRGRACYERRFAVRHAVALLDGSEWGPPPCDLTTC